MVESWPYRRLEAKDDSCPSESIVCSAPGLVIDMVSSE
jgi:hypothetical protein